MGGRQVSHIIRRREVPSAIPGQVSPCHDRGRALDPSHVKRFIQVAVATLIVAGVPVATVWWLRASAAIPSPALGVVAGMGLSLTLSWIGCRVWESRPGSEDLLFSELLIWGFVHRWRTQRRLASARELLGPISEAQPSCWSDSSRAWRGATATSTVIRAAWLVTRG
jgi:hypothetical protein